MAATVTLGRYEAKEKHVRRWTAAFAADERYGSRYDSWRSTTRGRQLDEADLLAPNLLDAPVHLEAFRSMRPCLARLNDALLQVPKNVDLAEANEGHLDAVGDLVAVLDAHDLVGWDVATLTKVLHRKRPRLVPLWDEAGVRRAYVAKKKAPVPPDAGRSSRDLYRAVSVAMKEDVSQPVFADLADEHAGLTPLRALDVALRMRSQEA